MVEEKASIESEYFAMVFFKCLQRSLPLLGSCSLTR